MTSNRRRIDQVLEESFTAALEDVSIDELRERRRLCDDLDTELSYYRRMLHGRMDLLNFELRRRSGEETRSLIEALPDILSDTPAARTSNPLDRELSLDLPELSGTGRREVDDALGDGFLAHLPSLETDELTSIHEALRATEQTISSQRRSVYDAHDLITSEIGRRYREGTTSASDILTTT